MVIREKQIAEINAHRGIYSTICVEVNVVDQYL